ncbi:MAG TPA: hypothetical protein VKU01_09030 [Bryobacteraceae bacterium]|nr:hypothetical protein [Bryobacteraceae bacterium]
MATGETEYRGRRAFRIEDDAVAVTVSVEGGHIAELIEKSTGVNPLWSPPWPSIEPSAWSMEAHPEYGDNSESKLLAGILGHNLALDIFGGPSPEEYTAGITVHGEASVVAYQIDVEGKRLTARAHLPLAQLDFSREIDIRPGGVVGIRETVTNLTAMDRPIAWTQHVTLGPPFIEPGVTQLRIPAHRSMVYPTDLSPEHQPYRPGAEFTWPVAPTKDGGTLDLSVFPAREHSAGVTCHVVDEDREESFFVAWHPQSKVFCRYTWRRSDFPWISLWEENCSRTIPPWKGNTITRGVEFGVSPFAEGRRAMIERGSLFGVPTYRWVPASATVVVEYTANVGLADSLRPATNL